MILVLLLDANPFQRWKPSAIDYDSLPRGLVLEDHSKFELFILPFFLRLLGCEELKTSVTNSPDDLTNCKHSTRDSMQWAMCGTQAMIGLDGAMEKKFWAKRNIVTQLGALAVADLLLGFCFDELTFAHFTLRTHPREGPLDPARVSKYLENFIECCIFTIEKLATLRTLILQHLGLRIGGFQQLTIQYCKEIDKHSPLAVGNDIWNAVCLLNHAQSKSSRDIPIKTSSESQFFMEQMLLRVVALGSGVMCDHALSLGIDPNVSDLNNSSALHLAIRWDNIAALRSLLQAGANMEHEDAGGRTPLLAAIKDGKEMAVEILLENGAQFDSGVIRALHTAVHANNRHAIEVLLRKGADPNTLNRAGQTALHVAVLSDNHHAIELMLRRGADPKVPDFAGLTVLHIAAIENNECVIQILLRAGANAEDLTPEGNTALNFAIDNNCTSAAEELVRNGANVSSRDLSGLTRAAAVLRRGFPRRYSWKSDDRRVSWFKCAKKKLPLHIYRSVLWKF